MRIILAAIIKLGREWLHTNSPRSQERPRHFGSACITCIEDPQITLPSDQSLRREEDISEAGAYETTATETKKRDKDEFYSLEAGRRDEVTGSAGESFDVVQTVSRPCPV